jgi:hypothetical protein
MEEFEEREKSHEFFDVLHAPYVQGFAEIAERAEKE